MCATISVADSVTVLVIPWMMYILYLVSCSVTEWLFPVVIGFDLATSSFSPLASLLKCLCLGLLLCLIYACWKATVCFLCPQLKYVLRLFQTVGLHAFLVLQWLTCYAVRSVMTCCCAFCFANSNCDISCHGCSLQVVVPSIVIFTYRSRK